MFEREYRRAETMVSDNTLPHPSYQHKQYMLIRIQGVPVQDRKKSLYGRCALPAVTARKDANESRAWSEITL
jgi:hypothetical protein